MRSMILLSLTCISPLAWAEVYKCQVTDKQFIYQSTPCADKKNQQLLNIEKQTPEEIEKAQKQLEAIKKERQTLDETARQQQQIDDLKRNAEAAKREAEAAKRAAKDAQRAAEASQQNSTTVITPYYPYPLYYPDGYGDNSNRHHHPYYPRQSNNPYPFYSPNRSLSPNFSPYPNTGPNFSPVPNTSVPYSPHR